MNKLIDVYPDAVLLQDKFGRTPLYLAVEYKIGESISILEQLLCAPIGTDALTIPCFGQEISIHYRDLHDFIEKFSICVHAIGRLYIWYGTRRYILCPVKGGIKLQ